MRSPAEHVAEAIPRLIDAGLSAEEARFDASLLARHVLGWDAAEWLTHLRDPAPPHFPAAFAAAITRRAAREPVAYITGTREFYGRTFMVTPDVLIPRPETEGLIDAALEHMRTRHVSTKRVSTKHQSTSTSTSTSTEHSAKGCFVLADIGTGSGCLAITLACEVPSAFVIATDTSAAALAIARDNAARLGVSDRVVFVQGSWLAGRTEAIDLIVSNPPYVPEPARGSLAPEVVTYEPHAALFAGADGLDAYRAIAPLAARTLVPGGVLLCEIGEGQTPAVPEILTAAGLQVDGVQPDLQGIPRIVIARRAMRRVKHSRAMRRVKHSRAMRRVKDSRATRTAL